MRALLIALLSVSFLSTAPGTAEARKPDPAVSALPFGGDLRAVRGYIKKRFLSTYAGRIAKAVEVAERTKLRAERDRRTSDIMAGYVAFDGTTTGYEVSLLSSEFVSGTAESLLKYSHTDGDHFFFFLDGKLWKYGFAERAGEAFQDKIAALNGRFGKPEVTEEKRLPSGDDTASKVRWQHDRITVRLEDHRVLYGNDLMVVEHRPVADNIKKLRKGKTPVVRKIGVRDELSDFLVDDDEDEELQLDPRTKSDDRK